MAPQNNHYVPKFLLKRFGDKINTYNLKSGVFAMRNKLDKSFCVNGLYEDELERLFNIEAESKMSQLLFDKLMANDDEIILTRSEVFLLKKFFAIEQLRTPDTVDYIKHQREYFRSVPKERLEVLGYFDNETSNLPDDEYLSLTLRNILEYDGTAYMDFFSWCKGPDVTLVAQKWLRIFNECYLAFWDSSESGEDFLITDRGMTCEHDPSKFLPENKKQAELIKPGFMMSLLFGNFISKAQKKKVLQFMFNQSYVGANFYFFSLTPTRTIALIDPFFRTYDRRDDWSKLHLPIPDVWPSGFQDKGLIEKNKNVYKDKRLASVGVFDKDDQYIYKVHDMRIEDVIYYNCLLLDRVHEVVGFGDTAKIIRSLATYLQISKPLNHYEGLKEQLEKNGYDVPSSQKYKDLAYMVTEGPWQEAKKAEKYINIALSAIAWENICTNS